MIKTKLLSISLFSLALAGCATTGSWSCQISGGGEWAIS